MSNKISGLNVQLFVKLAGTPTVLAGQKNASLKRSADSIDSTSKDSTGGWKEEIAGFKSWSIDADGCFIESDAAFTALETAFVNGDNVDVEIHFPSGSKYSGSASISDSSLEMPFDSLVTYKLQLSGSGALTLTPGA